MDNDQVSLNFWSWCAIRSVAIFHVPVSACWFAAFTRKCDHATVDRNPTGNGSRYHARRHHLYCWKRVKYQKSYWNINHALIRQSVIFGALLSGIVNTNTLLLGCSGGDYCLILASFANVLLNLDHMHWLGFLIRFFPVAVYVTFDIYETYQRYIRLTIIDIFYKLLKLNILWASNTWIRVWDKSATRLISEEPLLG